MNVVTSPIEENCYRETAVSDRQREVMEAVLMLMVEEGDGFSMAKVCRRASCSKETLYNWYGDRDGLLTATVQWQASKVVMPEINPDDLDAFKLRSGLTEFAVSWLEVITSDVSAALNRLAISHAGSAKSRLGEIVLLNGPLAMRSKLHKIITAGMNVDLLKREVPEKVVRTFFGLVVADWQIRKLLGETTKPSISGIKNTAQRAVEEFLLLYGAGGNKQ